MSCDEFDPGHLAGCATCRAKQDARDRALARFSALPRTEPPASVWAGIEEKIGREMMAAPRRPARRWLLPAWGIGVAAAVLAVVVMHPIATPPVDDPFIQARRSAYEAGRHGGDAMAAKKAEILRHADVRLLAALMQGHWERELAANAEASNGVGAALLEMFEGGARAGLDPDWFFRDSEERAARELREAFLKRLGTFLTEHQMEIARELAEGD